MDLAQIEAELTRAGMVAQLSDGSTIPETPRESRSFWVLFTPDGIPGWIGDAPRDGAEQVDGLTIPFLAAHRRTAEGAWVKRDPVVPVPPTAEEIAAQREAEYQAALEAREQAIDAALVASAPYRQFIRGELTLTAYRDAAAKIAATFPLPVKAAV